MSLTAHPDDPHLVHRAGWLRASVMGANDGILSVASLIVGVAAAGADLPTILLGGTAALTAGAMSMAAGEYVSVSSQADVERADIAREAQALRDEPERELAELAALYEARGLSPATARRVAEEMTAQDALAAHMREELGLTGDNHANPLQAALASGATFTVSGAGPLLAAALAPEGAVIPVVLGVTLAALSTLGALGAMAGGAPVGRAAGRVAIWGALAMAATAAVGQFFGQTLG